MSHKVHPKIFRIRETADWYSRWMNKSTYQESLRGDFLIRTYLLEKLKEANIESIEIERFAQKILIILNT